MVTIHRFKNNGDVIETNRKSLPPTISTIVVQIAFQNGADRPFSLKGLDDREMYVVANELNAT
jgi:hypothetical protein